jgi:hypothetical protein
MYASIDLVSHKLAKKLRRHKDKIQSKRKNEKVGGSMTEEEEDVIFNEEDLLLDLNIEDQQKALSSLPMLNVDVDTIRTKVMRVMVKAGLALKLCKPNSNPNLNTNPSPKVFNMPPITLKETNLFPTLTLTLRCSICLLSLSKKPSPLWNSLTILSLFLETLRPLK